MAETDQSATANHDRFYLQLLHLLEFTRDMDRNNDDARFAQADGTIYYVFDENVFEFFIGARDQQSREQGTATGNLLFEDKRRYSAMFHLEAWRDRPDDNSTEERWTRVNRQTAVVTAEYLLSGALPGQRERKLYLTEWHSRELRGRIKALADHFVAKAKQAMKRGPQEEAVGKYEAPDQIQLDIDAVSSLAQQSDVTVDDLIRAGQLSPIDRDEIQRDLKRLGDAKVSIDNKTLLSFATARILVSKLIDDDILEPLQQIKRIYSREIAKRLHPVQLLKERPGPTDRQEIEARAKEWMALIKREEEMKTLPPRNRRQEGRLAVDAASLAQVQWIANQMQSDRHRIVLVTGDTLMFDAYRRWWAERPNVPFILRRITQYAPILNFKDAMGEVAANENIFANTRRAIEPALMFFNLAEQTIDARIGSDKAESKASGLNRGVSHFSQVRQYGAREHFALLLKTKGVLRHDVIKMFTYNVGTKITEERQRDYQEIRDKWQELERLALGLNKQLVERRSGNEQHVRLQCIRAGGRGMEDYINETLDELYSQNALLYVPDAFRQLRRWLQPNKQRFTRRVPIAMLLHVAVSAREGRWDVAELADHLITRAHNRQISDEIMNALEGGEWLSEHPELLFAIAAVVALRLALWNRAAEYAQLAAGADSAEKIKAQPELDDQADYFELLYLRAVANRFKMGDISGSVLDGEARSRELLDSARRDLAACIDYYQRPRPGPPCYDFQIIRTLSERAALSLFYASWMLRAGAGFDTNRERTINELRHANKDIQAAIAILAGAHERGIRCSDKHYDKTKLARDFEIVKKQISVNTAACYVFAKLLELRGEQRIFPSDADIDHFKKLHEELTARFRGVHSTNEVSAEVADFNAFLFMFDGSEAACRVLEGLSSDRTDASLHMDAELVRVYKQQLPQTSGLRV